MKKILNIFYENLKLIIISLISIILIMIVTIILSITIGDEIARQPIIAEIRGEGEVMRRQSRLSVNKNMRLLSGDTVRTGEDSYLKIHIDDDKYFVLEENSVAQIYYTEVANKGTVELNVTQGSALTGLSRPLKKNSSFNAKTPNSVVEADESVFRVKFEHADRYLGHNDVYVTEVQNFSGSVGVQLYDIDSNPAGEIMPLKERAFAKMITNPETSQYLYLNSDTKMDDLSERALTELLKISVNSGKLAYAIDELNFAFKAVQTKNMQGLSDSDYNGYYAESAEELIITTASDSYDYIPIYPDPPPEPPALNPFETEPHSTLATTLRTHVYTTFAGERWWEIPVTGPPDSYDDDSHYDDSYYDDSYYDDYYDDDYYDDDYYDDDYYDDDYYDDDYYDEYDEDNDIFYYYEDENDY